MSHSNSHINVLHIEDDEAERILVNQAFKSSGFFNIFAAQDGDIGLEMLKQERQDFKSLPLFDLVLLDIGLPTIDGFEVLKRIRNDKEIRDIPVIILSGTEDDMHISKSYEIGANCFVPKKEGISGYNKIADQIEAFWRSSIEIPNIINL